MKETIIQLIIQQSVAPNLTILETSRFTSDLGYDSLDFGELMVLLENKTGINILESDTSEFVTIGDVINYFENQLNTKIYE